MMLIIKAYVEIFKDHEQFLVPKLFIMQWKYKFKNIV